MLEKVATLCRHWNQGVEISCTAAIPNWGKINQAPKKIGLIGYRVTVVKRWTCSSGSLTDNEFCWNFFGRAFFIFTIVKTAIAIIFAWLDVILLLLYCSLLLYGWWLSMLCRSYSFIRFTHSLLRSDKAYPIGEKFNFQPWALSVLVVPTWPSVVISSSNTLSIHSLETAGTRLLNFA